MSIDWDATGSMLQGWGSLGSVFTLAYAAWKGAQAYEIWRTQRVAERRQEHAEKILVASHRAKDVLAQVRSGVIWWQDLEAAEAKLKEDSGQWGMHLESKRRRLVKAQVLLDRLNRGEDIRRDLLSCIPFARMHFGTELEEAIDKLPSAVLDRSSRYRVLRC